MTTIIHALPYLPDAPTHKTTWPWVPGDPAPVMAESPKISIITLVDDQSPFFEETIRSVLLQGYPNLEYIVFVDGSVAANHTVIKKYEQWITYIESSAGKTSLQAINAAIQRTKGDVIGWLNSGDLYTPDALSIIARRLSNVSSGMLVGATKMYSDSDTFDGKIVTGWPSWEKTVF